MRRAQHGRVQGARRHRDVVDVAPAPGEKARPRRVRSIARPNHSCLRVSRKREPRDNPASIDLPGPAKSVSNAGGMSWMIGVDVGGTFTDFFAFDDTSDRIVLHKVASTPANPAEAVIAGLRELAARHAIELAAVTRLSHGTTVATNALIQRRGGRVALVVTEGFRDLIEIGRQIRPHVFSLQDDYPARWCRANPPRGPERITADGKDPRLSSDARSWSSDRRGEGGCLRGASLLVPQPAHEAMIGAALKVAYPDMYLRYPRMCSRNFANTSGSPPPCSTPIFSRCSTAISAILPKVSRRLPQRPRSASTSPPAA